MGRWHANAIRRAGGRVSFVVDPDLSRAQALARRYGAVAVADVHDIDCRGQVDVAHICTPVETHYALATSLIPAGLHLLIEKPLTRSAADTARLFELASAQRVLVCPVHQFLFQTGVMAAGKSSAAIGPILHLDYIACSAGAAGRAADVADTIAAEILPHPLSLVRRLLVESLAEVEWRVLRPRAGELRIIGQRGDVSLSMLLSMHGRPTENSLRLIGERGSVAVDLFHGFAVRFPGDVSRWRKMSQPFTSAGVTALAAATNLALRATRGEPAYPGLRALVGALYDSIATGAPSPISPNEAVDVAVARDRILSLAFDRSQ
jgi:predicted dehydrogenase